MTGAYAGFDDALGGPKTLAGRPALMEPRTILINSSHGGLIDTAALAQALHRGQILGAGA